MRIMSSPRLSDIPLWRLLVMLDDAERVAGPGSTTARTLALDWGDEPNDELPGRTGTEG